MCFILQWNFSKATSTVLEVTKCSLFGGSNDARWELRIQTFSKMFCNTSCSLWTSSCAAQKYHVPNPATTYDYDLSVWMHLSTYQLQPRHHHHLPMLPVWPPWWIQKPPYCRWSWIRKGVKENIWEKIHDEKKRSGLWKVVNKNHFRARFENFPEREEPTEQLLWPCSPKILLDPGRSPIWYPDPSFSNELQGIHFDSS